MALIPCPECKSDISDQAAACPRCGFPVSAHRVSANEAVRAALSAGNTIEAIKIYRNTANLGLKESKDAVDLIENDMRQSGLLPPATPASSFSSFVLVLVLLLILLGGIALWILRH